VIEAEREGDRESKIGREGEREGEEKIFSPSLTSS